MSAAQQIGESIALRGIVFIASCPGENERNDDRPLHQHGVSGISARELAEVYHEECPEVFTSANLDDYSLLNADSEARVPPDDTAPTCEDVLAEHNLTRVCEFLRNIEARGIILLGNPARCSWNRASQNLECLQIDFVHRLPHPQNPNSPALGNRRENWRHHVRGQIDI